MRTKDTTIIIKGKVIYKSPSREPEIRPDKLLYDRHQVSNILRPYFDNKSSHVGIILSQSSVAITILLTILVSKFEEKWGLSGDDWSMIMFSFLTLIVFWSISIIFKMIKQPNYDQFMEQLVNSSLTISDRRFVILIFALDKNGNKKILAEKSDTWDCWLLPNYGKSKSTSIASEANLKTFLASKFNKNADSISIIAEVSDLITYKNSYKDEKFKNYYFDFQIAIFRDSATLLDTEFTINGTLYRWTTIDELLSDKNTRERNGDVLNHVRDRIIDENKTTISFPEGANLIS